MRAKYNNNLYTYIYKYNFIYIISNEHIYIQINDEMMSLMQWERMYWWKIHWWINIIYNCYENDGGLGEAWSWWIMVMKIASNERWERDKKGSRMSERWHKRCRSYLLYWSSDSVLSKLDQFIKCALSGSVIHCAG